MNRDEITANFACNLRYLRKAKGQSVVDLALESGVPAQVIWRIESGKGGCTVWSARMLADTLGASLDAMTEGKLEACPGPGSVQ